jgi:RP/EB family microtubule-associated protein
VNWKAKNDYEFVANLKILQSALDKTGIKKHLEVEKLAKAKYQDNLEFIQWLKRYYSLNCGERGSDYRDRAEERRGNAAVDFSFAEKTASKIGSDSAQNEPKKHSAHTAATKATITTQKEEGTLNAVKSPAPKKKVEPPKKGTVTKIKQ